MRETRILRACGLRWLCATLALAGFGLAGSPGIAAERTPLDRPLYQSPGGSSTAAAAGSRDLVRAPALSRSQARVFPAPPHSPKEALERLEAMAIDPTMLLFDSAHFDPLVHGEPDLTEFVPDTPGFDTLPTTAERLAIVQFHRAPGASQRALLTTAGASPLFYVPHRAYLVRADGEALSRLAANPDVRWVGRYRPGYKVDNRLGRLAAGFVPEKRLPGEGQQAMVLDLLVIPQPDLAAVTAAILGAVPSATILAEEEAGRLGVVTLSLGYPQLQFDLARVAALEQILAIEGHGQVRLHNDDAVWIGQSYDLFQRQNYAQSATIWEHGLLGDGEIIGIADSGVDPDTCWLEDPAGLPPVSQVPAIGADRGPIPVDLSRRKIIAYNLLGSQQAMATPYDVRTGDPHGTWIAVAAAGDNPAHPASESDPLGNHHDFADGMAPMAKLVIEDMGDDDGELVGLSRPIPRLVDQIFEQMRDAGVRISTNSWGVEGNQYDLFAFFTDAMAFNHPDFLMLFSAGNSGPVLSSLASPATAKNVITVGASESRFDAGAGLDPENVGEFSSRGPTSDGRIKPDLVISGSRLITGDSDLAEVGATCDTVEVSGTSFATPIAAGFAALAREYYRKGFYPTGAARAEDEFFPSAALLKATMIAGARNMTGKGGSDYSPCEIDTCDVQVGLCRTVFLGCNEDADCSRCNGNASLKCSDDRDCDLSLLSDDSPAMDQGWGRIHLDDALFFDGDARSLAVWDIERSEGLGTGETWAAEFYVGSTAEDLQLVLTWPDPPALIASPTYLVNDLDLRVIAPDGTVYWGNAWPTRDRNPFLREYSVSGLRPMADVDTVEMVRLAGFTLATGVWRVEVYGDNVPGSPLVDGGSRQDFAVVAVGPVSTQGGTVSFDKERYSCSGAVTLQLLDSNASGPVDVTAGTASGDSETVTLLSVGGGRFEGTIPLVSNQVIATENGTLEVTDSEILDVVYHDLNPSVTSTDSVRVECGGQLVVSQATISGGCDGDGYLDAGETVSLQLSLANVGRTTLEGVQLEALSAKGDLFVEVGGTSFGTLAPGASVAAGTPLTLSLRDGATARESRVLNLEVSVSGSTLLTTIPLELLVEADEQRTEDTWSEDFTTGSATCHDPNAQAPTDSWYFFDLNEDCASSEDTWQTGLCFGQSQVMMPSCIGTWISTSNETHHRLVSPRIITGAAGSRTILKTLRFDETYHFLINEDGRLCDRTVVELFTNNDGRLLPSGYYRDRSADGDDQPQSLDLTSLAEYSLPPVPDGTQLQLIFHVASNDKLTGASSCSGSSGDEYRWRVDNVELDYENIEIIDDLTPACGSGCVAPAAPTAVTASRLSGRDVIIGWDPVPGADHYVIYRSDGSSETFVSRVRVPQAGWVDTPPGDGPWTYSVEAVDSSGLCPSPRAGADPWEEALECSVPPAPPQGLSAVDDALSTCQLTLSWSPVAPPCGGPVSYRLYRSRDPEFIADASTLLAETAATTLVDSALTSGWDDDGEPAGDVWIYELRTVDSASGIEGPGTRISTRAGGLRQPGQWIDDGGDDHLPKMVSITSADELASGAGWSRSPFALHRGGSWSYWSDPQASGDGGYEALTCISLVSPPVELDPGALPELSLWVNYEIEYQWDGLVVELAGANGSFAPITPVGGYPGSFAETIAPPCQGSDGGAGDWINACDYAPSQGAITGPEFGGLSGWENYLFDLSAWAGQTVTFRSNLSTDCGTGGGAVLDDFSISGALLPTACDAGSCLPAPEFAGLIAAQDLDPLLTDGIELSWGEIPDWGGGGVGSIEVYRDSELITSLPASARSYLDQGVEANIDTLYQVVARSGSGCDLPSEGVAQLIARDCGSPAPPAQQAAELTVLRAGTGPSLILRTEGVPGAATYRFPWSHSPSDVAASAQALESLVPEARHGVEADGLNYFYLAEGGAAPDCP